MEYIGVIFKLIMSVLISLFVYHLLKNKGFKWTLIIKIIMQFIIMLFDSVIHGSEINFLLIILTIILAIIVQVIETGIQFFAYKRTNSFIFYLIVSEFLGVVVSAILNIVFPSYVNLKKI